jgi:hypothetical protein
MFEKDTVLILGAGASVDAGFPLADKLVHEIFINAYRSNQSSMLGLSHFLGLMKSFDPINIDKFLKDISGENSKELILQGKRLIAEVLLECEDKKKLEADYRTSGKENWYRYLVDAITSGCGSDPTKILDNKLKIITFNYDVSLEYYLSSRLPRASFFNVDDKNYAEEYVNGLINDNIVHVYGKLWDDVEPISCLYGSRRQFSKHRQFSRQHAKHIYVIDEDKQAECAKQKRIHHWLLAAKKIVILGYSFDQFNNSLLFDGVAADGVGYNILRAKCIDPTYRNYKLKDRLANVNDSLLQDCEHLDEFCYLNFADSNIIDAYVSKFLCNDEPLHSNVKKFLRPIICKSRPGKTISEALQTDFNLN